MKKMILAVMLASIGTAVFATGTAEWELRKRRALPQNRLRWNGGRGIRP